MEPLDLCRQKLKIGLDIDDTITASPVFFSFLSHAVKSAGGSVYVVSTRSNTPEVAEETRKELAQHNILFDDLYLLPDAQAAAKECPFTRFDWYQKYIWQKAAFCQLHKVDVYFDDDHKVIDIFQEAAPEIQVLRVCKRYG